MPACSARSISERWGGAHLVSGVEPTQADRQRTEGGQLTVLRPAFIRHRGPGGRIAGAESAIWAPMVVSRASIGRSGPEWSYPGARGHRSGFGVASGI